MATQRSATQGDWVSAPAWPPVMALTLREGSREGDGTTGSAERRMASSGAEPGPERLEECAHVVDRAAAEVAHAAVGHVAVRDDVEPVDAPVSHAHPVRAERLRE